MPKNAPNLLPETPLERAYGLHLKCIDGRLGRKGYWMQDRQNPKAWIACEDAPCVRHWA